MADEKLKAKTSETQSSELMKHAKSQTYCAKEDPKDKTNAGHHAMDNCIELFKLDYDVEIIDNTGGKLCSHYPAQIVLMGEKRRQECPVRDAEGQQLTLEKARKTLQDVMEKAAASRCRFRFVTPVIYFNGQYVCRSATLAGSKELTLRMASDTVNSAAEAVISTAGAVASTAVGAGAKIYEVGKGWLSYSSAVFWWGGKTEEAAADETDGSPPAEADAGDLSRGTEIGNEEAKANLGLYEEYFRNKVDKDKELLQKLNVLHICDLMVEEAKVKYGMVFSSSEKSDQEQRYRDFKLYGFPYPGCEFFADWNANDRRAKGLHYTWHESRNDAVLNVGEPKSVLRELEIDWGKMREWDLEQLTLNYVQALVKLVATGEHGLLVHCISGWDRTPLFISLLRLSLWADGLIHPSLEPAEMMYLTLAYDWYLFGHNYPDRRRKGQEVLPFCFIMLPKLADQRFSAHSYGTFPGKPSPMKSPTPSSGSKLSPTLRRSTRLSEKEQGAQPSAAADNRFWPYPSKSQTAQETSTRHPKTKATTSKSALSSPSKTAVSAAVSPRSKSHSPSRVTSVSSVSMEGRAAAGGGVDLSPSKGLAEGLSALSAASPTKRRSTEKEPGPGSASPAKKMPSFASLGELVRQEMDGMLGIHSYLKSRRAQKVKENVDPNTTAAAKETEPGLVKSTDNGDFEKVGPSDWHRLSAREKRLLAVNYIFRSVEARSEGLTPDDPKEESWRDYVYGSSSGNTFAPTAWSSLMSLFSPGETAAGAGKQPAATEEAAKAEGCGVPSAAATTTTVAGEAVKTGGQKPGDADASEKAAAEGTGRYVTILGERIPEDELGVQDLDDSFEVLAREVGPSGEVAETGV